MLVLGVVTIALFMLYKSFKKEIKREDCEFSKFKESDPKYQIEITIRDKDSSLIDGPFEPYIQEFTRNFISSKEIAQQNAWRILRSGGFMIDETNTLIPSASILKIEIKKV